MQPSEVTVLKATGKVGLPSEPNCLNQLAHVHRLRDSEMNYNEHQFLLNMELMRNREGLCVPLKMGMERFAARQMGRLPFLPSRWVKLWRLQRLEINIAPTTFIFYFGSNKTFQPYPNR